MTTLPAFADGQFSLTTAEIDYLNSLLSAGDRAGFYVTYGSMIAYRDENGRNELAAQAKIATFSDNLGATAYLSNRLLQESFSQDYEGIYEISLSVVRDFGTDGGLN